MVRLGCCLVGIFYSQPVNTVCLGYRRIMYVDVCLSTSFLGQCLQRSGVELVSLHVMDR